MDTLYLVPETWDLAVDFNGNIAVASNPYSLAQDAASAVRTYKGEVYFNTLIGIPYSIEILGNGKPIELYRAQAIRAALTVPEVTGAQLFFTGFNNRELQGQLQVTSQQGVTVAININSAPQTPNIFILGSSVLNGTDLLG